MKKIILLVLVCIAIVSCKNESKKDEFKVINSSKEITYASYGMQINDADALSADRMLVHYQGMKAGDTINSKMKGEIVDVCSKKGCWMRLNMGHGEQVMVKFKDYGFFVPTDAKGNVVINGKAFVTETSVDELRHYAEDAGKSEEEIAQITEPKLEYRFLADGVLLNQAE